VRGNDFAVYVPDEGAPWPDSSLQMVRKKQRGGAKGEGSERIGTIIKKKY